jgi:hypothetical protein
MTINYGKRNPGGLTAASPGDTLYIPFATYNDSGASIGIGGTLAVSDIEIFKNGGVTARSTDSGYSLISDTGQYGDRAGLHRFSISIFNTADDTGFFDEGSQYHVAVDSITVDSRPVRFFPAVFEIGTERANVTQVNDDTGAAAHLGQMADEYDTGRLPAEATATTDTGAIANAVWNSLTADHGDTGTFGELLRDPATASVDTGAVNSAVWDGVRSAHTAAGSFGEYVLSDIQRIDGDTGAADVLGKATDGTGGISFSAGIFVDTLSAAAIAQVADGVWDEADTGHGDTGTFGRLRQSVNVKSISDTGINDRLARILADTDTGIQGGVNVSSFGDTGINDRLARILADTDTGIQGGVHVVSISDTGVNERLAAIEAHTDTGIQAGLSVGVSSFSDTGVNDRLAKILADTDTGIQPPTAATIAASVWDDNDTGHGVNIRYVNATLITGTGDTGATDTWRPA